jgi:uncharacterized RDD family membrane protein YckC
MTEKIEYLDYCSLFKRILAFSIDTLFFCVVFFPITYFYKGTWLMLATDHDWNYGLFIFDPICLVFLISIFLYFIFLEGIYGFTIGKRCVKIKVVNIKGEVIGIKKSILRNIFRMIDGLPALNILGIYLILTSPENTRLGDIIARSRVINIK